MTVSELIQALEVVQWEHPLGSTLPVVYPRGKHEAKEVFKVLIGTDGFGNEHVLLASHDVVMVRELPETDWNGSAVLVRRGDEHFVISSTSALGTPETLAFPADRDANVTSWVEVAGGPYQTYDDCVARLATT